MRRTSPLPLALAAALTATGCASTHLGGTYRPWTWDQHHDAKIHHEGTVPPSERHLAGDYDSTLPGVTPDNEYRPLPAPDASGRARPQMLAIGGEWRLFWGLIDAGHFDVHTALRQSARPDEVIENVEVKDRLSLGGFFLFIASAGILSHHNIEVKGEPVLIAPVTSSVSSVPAPGYYPHREHENILVQPNADKR